MIIQRVTAGPLQENCYFLYQRNGKECFVVDPGYDAPRLQAFLQRIGRVPRAILLTHRHEDHTGAVENLLRQYPVPVMIHPADGALLPFETEPLRDGQKLELEGETLEVIHTPGHTPGCVCYYSAKSRMAMTGDTVFDADLGRTVFAGGAPGEMTRTIRRLDGRTPDTVTP